VFTWEDGRAVKDFRGAWEQTRRDAGMPDLLVHDFRRSAVRNMRLAGINQDVAKRITGHKTDSMYSRYNIVDEADLIDAAERMDRRSSTTNNGGQSTATPENGCKTVTSSQ